MIHDEKDLGDYLFKAACAITEVYAAGLRAGLKQKQEEPKVIIGFQPPDKKEVE